MGAKWSKDKKKPAKSSYNYTKEEKGDDEDQYQHKGHFVLSAESSRLANYEQGLSHFEALPMELIVTIIARLSLCEMLRLMQTSKAFFMVTSESYIWKEAYRRTLWHTGEEAQLQNQTSLSPSPATSPAPSPIPALPARSAALNSLRLSQIKKSCCWKKQFFSKYTDGKETRARKEHKLQRMKLSLSDLKDQRKMLISVRDSEIKELEQKLKKSLQALDDYYFTVSVLVMFFLVAMAWSGVLWYPFGILLTATSMFRVLPVLWILSPVLSVLIRVGYVVGVLWMFGSLFAQRLVPLKLIVADVIESTATTTRKIHTQNTAAQKRDVHEKYRESLADLENSIDNLQQDIRALVLQLHPMGTGNSFRSLLDDLDLLTVN